MLARWAGCAGSALLVLFLLLGGLSQESAAGGGRCVGIVDQASDRVVLEAEVSVSVGPAERNQVAAGIGLPMDPDCACKYAWANITTE